MSKHQIGWTGRSAAAGLLVAALVLCTPGLVWADRYEDDSVGRGQWGELSPDVRETTPDMDVPAAILATAGGDVLWARNPTDPRPMASTTKIMTCLLVLEATDPGDEVTVSARAAAVGGSGVYLQAGETRTVDELLHALMMESANAAGVALAEHVAGSEADFVDLMNDRAGQMGLSATAFRNPHGLHAEGHRSSAADLARLAAVAMSEPDFRDLVGTQRVSIPGPNGSRELENSNELIGSYEGATGVKTGWTNPAGYCLVASAERDGISLMCVVLGADSEDARFEEARRLLDWGFAHYRPVTLASVEETVAAVTVLDYLDRTVIARVGSRATAVILDADGPIRREYEIVGALEAPVEQGQDLGVLRAYQGEVLLAEVPVVADSTVPAPDAWERFRIFVIRLWRSWFGQPDTYAAPAGA